MTGPKSKPKPGTRTPAATAAKDAVAQVARLGRRLHQPRDPHALHELVIAQTLALTGAQRVLLVLEAPAGWQLAGARVPTGETPDALLRAIAPWLDAARRSRAAALRHGPDGADVAAQRSCLVAPLIAGRERLGYLYADIDGTHGRFADAQRDLLAALAGQAAAALANLRAVAALEARVAERSAELEQRTDELALINSIQQGMAAALSFQGIVDVVGDKLREVFGTDDIGITWQDGKTELVHNLYVTERGRRLQLPSFSFDPTNRLMSELAAGKTVRLRDRAATDAYGIRTAPGTDPSRSSVFVPVRVGERLRGAVRLVSLERDDAFDDATVRLLETVAA